MLDRKEIEIEIARLEYGESSYPAYAKLANLYTIRQQMDREKEQATAPVSYQSAYLYAQDSSAIDLYGDTDFLRAIEGKNPAAVWAVIDDLMDTLHTVNPRVYDGVLRKIRAL